MAKTEHFPHVPNRDYKLQFPLYYLFFVHLEGCSCPILILFQHGGYVLRLIKMLNRRKRRTKETGSQSGRHPTYHIVHWRIVKGNSRTCQVSRHAAPYLQDTLSISRNTETLYFQRMLDTQQALGHTCVRLDVQAVKKQWTTTTCYTEVTQRQTKCTGTTMQHAKPLEHSCPSLTWLPCNLLNMEHVLVHAVLVRRPIKPNIVTKKDASNAQNKKMYLCKTYEDDRTQQHMPLSSTKSRRFCSQLQDTNTNMHANMGFPFKYNLKWCWS